MSATPTASSQQVLEQADVRVELGPDAGLEERISLRAQPVKLALVRLAVAIGLLVAWQVVAGRLVDKFWVSQPSEIWERLVEWTRPGKSGHLLSGYLFHHMWITIQETIYGFLVGASSGMLLGFVLGRYLTLAKVVEPFILAVYSLPRLALAPLFILWFGIGLQMKVVLAAVIVFFMVFWNTYAGVKDVDADLVDVVRVMGARPRQVLLKVILPSAMTWVFVGLKVSIPYALVGAVVGEIVASNRGLGYIIQFSAGQFDTAGVFAALFVLMILATLLNEGLDRAEQHVLRWKTAGKA